MRLAPCRLALFALAACTLLAVGTPAAAAPACSDELPELALGQNPDWLDNTCTVEIQCQEGGTVSCSSTNNVCSSQGDCVYCDGVRKACCPDTQACLDQCTAEFQACWSACGFGDIGSACKQECRDQRTACENACFF
jgi:hypothetical protein